MISILLVHFDVSGYNVLITKDDRKQKIYTWHFVPSIHKVPSKKYIKKITVTHGLIYVTDRDIIKDGGTILWKRKVNYGL